MTRRLFGTDGVRGRVGTELTPELALALGRAATGALGIDRPQVLIVRDTRESGPMLEAALAAGIAAAGGDVLLAGVLPTPAAAILVRKHGLDMAAVVSASHNPFADNGIKFFSGSGTKLDDGTEARVEELYAADPPDDLATVGRVSEMNGALEDYLRALQSQFPLDLAGRKIVLDCANGSASKAAPEIFRRLGAEITVISDEPDGRNINEDCGSTHIENLKAKVVEAGAEIGFAFDGDADRVLCVDAVGTPHDGDEITAVVAHHLRERGELSGGVAVTVMSNYGFHTAMDEAGIEVATTKVGDRHVLEELQRHGWVLGGEQSGHIIYTPFVPTGDGIAAALLMMRALGDRHLEEADSMTRIPQTLVNVVIADREAIEGAEELWEQVEAENSGLRDRGRALVRASGTEPLVRVMVEAPTRQEADDVAGRLVAIVERDLDGSRGSHP